MSELKAEQWLDYAGEPRPCYPKSEADKVIAAYQRNEKISIRDTRHQKYKRCMAMASNCRLRARWFGDNAFYKKEQWALQWHKRWLELAEKFKKVSK